MDQIKIGKFISIERKTKKLTQRDLAERLGISDKTISKWECGKGLPDVSLLLPLCNELEINVNELILGERIVESNYKKMAEENMVNLIKETQESKKKILLSAIVTTTTIVAAIPLIILSGVVQLDLWARICLVIIAFFVITSGIIVACILDREAGAFECPVCKTRFIPEIKDYVMGPHTLTKRKLKCPNCGNTKYCKHVLTK